MKAAAIEADKVRPCSQGIYLGMEIDRNKFLAQYETGVWIFLIVVTTVFFGVIFWMAYL